MMQILLIGPINQLGYGQTGLNILKALCKQADVGFVPVSEATLMDITNDEDGLIVQNAMEKAAMWANVGPLSCPAIKIWHQHDMRFPTTCQGPKIGFPIFELDKFRDIEVEQLNSTDHLFAPSQWGLDIFKQNGIEKPGCVVPLGVDKSFFDGWALPGVIPKRFFTCGKWEIRKGHDVLIKIWDSVRDKRPDHDWELHMMTENPFNEPWEEAQWRNLYKRDDIRFIPRVKTHREVYNIMRSMGCGVFPARAEGWNLELLEMLSCGKTCIATDYSAHTEFCNYDNCKLVTIDELEPAYDGKWFFGDGNWAKLSHDQIEHFAYHMVDVIDNPSANPAGVETANEFTWDNSAERIVEYVKTLL